MAMLCTRPLRTTLPFGTKQYEGLYVSREGCDRLTPARCLSDRHTVNGQDDISILSLEQYSQGFGVRAVELLSQYNQSPHATPQAPLNPVALTALKNELSAALMAWIPASAAADSGATSQRGCLVSGHRIKGITTAYPDQGF